MMRYLKIITDLVLTVVVSFFLICWMVMAALIGKRNTFPCRKLLVLDMAYTLEMIQKRQLQESITCRDLNGYFKHVWSVHPCATVIPPHNPNDLCGPVVETILSEKHTVAEGKIGRYNGLKVLPLLNYVLAQWNVYRYLVNLIKKEQICAIRAGDPYYLGLWALLLSKTCIIPCAVRVNVNYDAFYDSTGSLAFPRLFRRRWVEKCIDRFTLKRMDLVAGANQDNLNFALTNGARQEVATVFRYGNLIHPAHFRPPEERSSPQDLLEPLGLWNKPFSLTVSRLEPLKHPDDMLRVIAELKRRGHVLYALLAGDGTMRQELEGLTAELNISAEVVFAGNRDQEWLARVIPKAKVVISPFMGRALTETALGGVPIVAYDIDWQGELVLTGKTGELVSYRNWQAMADAVERYLRNAEYARRMGTHVRDFVLEMMDPTRLTRHEQNEYGKMLERYYGTSISYGD